MRLFATPWTVQSIEFSRPEYWVGRCSLLQGVFPSQGSNRSLPPCKWILYHLSHRKAIYDFQFSSFQSLSRVWLFVTPWIAARQASLSITNSRSLLRLMPIESVMPTSHHFLFRPLLLLPPIPPSIRVFSNESTLCMRWPKYWSFSFSISPSNEHPGLIFRMDWLDLLAVQGTLKSLLQHHSSKASIFRHPAFFTVQLSHPYIYDLDCPKEGRESKNWCLQTVALEKTPESPLDSKEIKPVSLKRGESESRSVMQLFVIPWNI